MWRASSVNTGRRCLFTPKLLRSASCRTFSGSHGEKVMAIRREDINVWERRSPISPAHVSELVSRGIKVLVQPSTRRAYTMDEYERAGAIISEDLTPASLIIGVKAVPIDLLLPNKTYAFFSHTIKAQEANMPLMDALLDKNIRIVDYEKMMDDKGRRVCAFGKFAGVGVSGGVFEGVFDRVTDSTKIMFQCSRRFGS